MDNDNFDSKDILRDAKINPEMDKLLYKIANLVNMSEEELKIEIAKLKKLKEQDDKNDAGKSATETEGNDEIWKHLFK